MMDMKWEELNWIGRFLIRFHNIILGPEYDFNNFEERIVRRWGMK